MLESSHQDKHLHTAFHISENEAQVLLKHHYALKAKLKLKLEKLLDKSLDSGTKYDVKIQELRYELEYHHLSIFNAEKLLEYYGIMKARNIY